MAETTKRFREQNNNWRGGRTVASNGYILVRVGVGHHLADVRGYAYEHRVVAEQAIGRRLKDGEIVHHKNETKTDNRPENLEVVVGNAEHFVKHRKLDKGLRLPGEHNPHVPCECGCGATISKFDISGRPRRFISGHNSRWLRGMVMHYLRCVPEQGTPRFISEMFDLSEGSVRNTLTALKKEGLVTRGAGRNGEWRLTSA